MIRTVIFDVDGTLLDTNYLHVEAWARAFLAVNRPVPRVLIHRQIGKGSQHLLKALLPDESLHRQVNALHSRWYLEMQHAGYPLPGAQEILARLSARHMNVWLATSANPEELDDHLKRLQVKGQITGMVSSADVTHAKPAPDIFQHTLEKAGASPRDCLVVGDTLWDIQAARGCGLRTIAVMTGGAFNRREFEEEGAMAVFQDCAELLASGFPESFHEAL